MTDRLLRFAGAASIVLGFAAFFTGGLIVSSARSQSIIINQLDDVPLGTWPGSGDLQAIEAHCVGMSSGGRRPTNEYRISIDGSGTGSRFELSNGTDTIEFQVEYRDNLSSTAWATIKRGGRSKRLQATTVTACNSGQTVQEFRVTVRQADLIGKSAGSYTGSLVLIVEPR